MLYKHLTAVSQKSHNDDKICQLIKLILPRKFYTAIVYYNYQINQHLCGITTY